MSEIWICCYGSMPLKAVETEDEAVAFCETHRAKLLRELSKPMQSYFNRTQAFWRSEVAITIQCLEVG